MTILEAITRCDSLLHNTYTRAEKLRWLSVLDALVHRQILSNREGEEPEPFPGYDEGSDLSTPLLVPPPHDELYLHHLAAQIHYHNGELERYNNAGAMFRTVFDSFRNDYNRSHPAKRRCFRFR